MKLVEKVAPRQGGESFEGTCLHWRTAKFLIEQLGAECDDFPPAPDVPATYVLPRSSEWLENWFCVHAKESIPDDWSLQVEVELRWEFPRFFLSGHHDVLAISPDGQRSHGIDWKAVYNAVPEAAQNPQVLGYLVLARLIYGVTSASFDIVQPRVQDADEVSTVTLGEDELKKSVAYLEKEINAALDNPNTVESGVSQCAWCPAMLQCPAIDKEIEFMQATLTPSFLEALKAEPNDERLAQVVVSARTIKRPIEDAEEMLRDRLETVGRINAPQGPSITMEKRLGQYSVIEGQELPLFQTAKEILPEPELAKTVKFSSDKVKQAVARVRGIPQSGKAPATGEKVFAERFKPFLEQGTTRILKFS